jgi:hypothetical protein
MCDEHNEMRPITGMRTADGIDFYNAGYFHYNYGSINVSYHRKINSYGFLYSLCAPNITCILQLNIMADSQ